MGSAFRVRHVSGFPIAPSSPAFLSEFGTLSSCVAALAPALNACETELKYVVRGGPTSANSQLQRPLTELSDGNWMPFAGAGDVTGPDRAP